MDRHLALATPIAQISPDPATPHSLLKFGILMIATLILAGCERSETSADRSEKGQEEEIHSPNPDETALDALGEKGGIWSLHGESAPFSGRAVERFKGGKVAVSSEFENGILLSTEEWLKNGTKKSQMLYRDGEGYFQTVWRTDGEKKIETGLKDGVPHGPHKRWHPNGQVGWTGEFYEGKFHGLVEDRDQNGILILKGKYDRGKLIEDLLPSE